MIEVIERYSRTEFVYGSADCCTFVAECVESETGKNPLNGFRYFSEYDANTFISSKGGMEGTISHFLGTPQPSDYESKNGDVAMVSTAGGLMAGVIFNGMIMGKTVKSITDWPLSRALKVWCT